MPSVVTNIQSAYRAWVGRRLLREQRAAVKIQKMWRGFRYVLFFPSFFLLFIVLSLFLSEQTGWIRVKSTIRIQLAYRRFRSNQWLWQVVSAFKNVRQDSNFGRSTQWPSHNPLYEKGASMLKKIWQQWWGKTKVRALSPEVHD
jgi:hypothetical protein